MQERKFHLHLRLHNCVLHRHGRSHDIWLCHSTRSETAVPRHREIPMGTVRAICKQLGIPIPSGR
ncbi:MAG: type II toxin-antitoxin system HicA family toxin [Burkholderiales bacterium]|nr:type II toxin-antitoxin system HicA family toxin [Phycisphaerae bacterium]